MKTINIKITNAKELINVLEEIDERSCRKYMVQWGTKDEGFDEYHASLRTLINILKEAK